MKLTYTNVNGYLLPNLTYKSGEQMEQLGKYGFLRRDYLKNHRNSTYQVMLLQDTHWRASSGSGQVFPIMYLRNSIFFMKSSKFAVILLA